MAHQNPARRDIDRSGDDLLLRLVGGDPAASAEVQGLASTSDNPALLVAAAILSLDFSHLRRAAALARSTRDRQLVVLAEAHLHRHADLFDVLVREHLADYPDQLLAAWLAAGRPLTHPT